MNSIIIKEEINTKTGKFSKAAFLNKIQKGIVKVYENNDKYDLEFRLMDAERFLKMKNGVSFNAKYVSQEEELKGYLGTSFNYKFTY